jgi:hypothetical protein
MPQHVEPETHRVVQPRPPTVSNVLSVVAEYAAAGEPVSETVNNLLRVLDWDHVDSTALNAALGLILDSLAPDEIATMSAVADRERSILVDCRVVP